MVSNLFFLLRDSETDLLLQVVGNSTARNFFWLHFARGHAYRSWSWGKSPALALKKPSREDQKPVSIFFSFKNTPCKYRSLRTYNEKKT